MNWSWEYFARYLFNDLMIAGAWTTLWLTVVSMAIGCALGAVAALGKMYGPRPVRLLAEFYIWVFRGTPLLIQLVIIYTGLPQIGIRFSVIESAIIGLALNEGAYLAEIVRAGIMSVNKGQDDAARALGMTWGERMRIVIMPQAARVIIPPLGNQFNGMLKTSSLASVISMDELLRNAQMLAQIEFRILEVYVCAALWYLAMVTVWNAVQKRIEARYERPFGAQPAPAARALREAAAGKA